MDRWNYAFFVATGLVIWLRSFSCSADPIKSLSVRPSIREQGIRTLLTTLIHCFDQHKDRNRKGFIGECRCSG